MITASPSVFKYFEQIHIYHTIYALICIFGKPFLSIHRSHQIAEMQHFGKGALRVAKNYTKGYSDTQAKVRDATSNDAWGPSGTQMNEIAQMTYNQSAFILLFFR